MPKYLVTVKEVYSVSYRIVADTREEAVQAIYSGEYLSLPGAVEPDMDFDHILKDETEVRLLEENNDEHA